MGLATAEGSLASTDGFDPAALAEAWSAHGDKALGALAGTDDGLDEPAALWDIDADVVFAGSRMGAVNHGVAEGPRTARPWCPAAVWPSPPRRWPCVVATA